MKIKQNLLPTMNTNENKSEKPITEYANEQYKKNTLKEDKLRKAWKKKEEKKVTKEQLKNKQIRAQLNRAARGIAREMRKLLEI